MTNQCFGVDGNRNFDINWGIGDRETSDVCDNRYYGSSPFSEPETRNVHDILESIKDNCKLYITLHSYGSKIMYPWGYKLLVSNVV